MISKCANPDCAIPLDYRQGRFFRFHKSYPEGAGPANPHSVQHFWLCECCSGIYTLECRSSAGVVIKLHFGQLSKTDMFRPIAAA
jgi:hypothetical protein